MTETVIDRITAHATQIAAGDGPVHPGQPAVLNEAAAVGDAVWQGDLLIEVVDAVPDEYVRSRPMTILVPGNTQGARHSLDALVGVDQFCVPNGWLGTDGFPAPAYEGLDGPAFVLTQERTITHPVHGDVTIAAGHTIRCSYQREWDAEQARERRNAD